MRAKEESSPALGLVLLAVIAWLFVSSQGPAPNPAPGPAPTPNPAPQPGPETPLAQYVRQLADQVTGATASAERAKLAENYRAIAAEIETLVDPLATSALKRPADAVERADQLNRQVLGVRSAAWDACFSGLGRRLETMDREGRIERSIYAVGEVYAEVARGLDPAPAESQASAAGDGIPYRLCAAAEGTPDFDPEAAYTAGAIGVYLDEPGQPQWARQAAREGEQQFYAAGGAESAAAFPAAFLGEGRGKRAVYWNYALRFDGDPLPCFAVKQITGNCVEASNGDVTLTHLLGVSIFLLKKPFEWEGPGSTVFYSRRGHCGAGMDLSIAAAAHLEDGALWRKQYLGGKYDLRDSTKDQQVGMQNCRSPKSSLADLWAEARKTPVGNVARFSGDAWEACDILYAGGALHTGSTATAARDGDPVSSGARVGPHAQTCIGYDDTEEFRRWYQSTTGKRLTEPVFIFDQTWGAAPYIKKNWPAHLWGKATPGMFVLRWSDARALIGSTCYAYWPDLQGVTPAAIKWRIDHARSVRDRGSGGNHLVLAN
jgi:hypothetical protein